MRGIVRIAAVMIALLALAVATSGANVARAAESQLDQSIDESLYSGYYVINSGNRAGQTFTAGLSGQLDRVSLYLGVTSTPNDLTVGIYATSGGVATGSALATTTISPSGLPSGSHTHTWADASFASPATVASGTQYAIVVHHSSSSGYYRWGDVGNVYAGGVAHYNSNIDHIFRTYVLPRSDQTITFGELADRTYGDDDIAPGATASSGLAVSYSASGQCSMVSGKIRITGAGTCTVTASQGGDDSYNAAPDVERSFSIAKAQLTVTAEDKTRVYGESNPAFTVDYSGFMNDEDASVLSGSPSCGTTATATSPVGEYSITCAQGTLSASNYDFEFIAGTLTIQKASPIITWADPADIVYGTPLGDDQLSAGSNVAGTFVYSPPAGTLLGAGEHTLSVSFSPDDATNYTGASKQVTIGVAKADQAITFDELADRSYGDPAIDLTASASSGLAVSFAAIGDCAISNGDLHLTGSGTCAVTASQGGNSNYNAAPDVERSFSIRKAQLTVTAEDRDSVYSDALPSLNYTIAGFVGTDSASLVSGTAVCTSDVATDSQGNVTSPAGSYAISCASSLTDPLAADDYTFTFKAGTLVVSQERTASEYTGDEYALTAGPTITTAPVRLSALLSQEADGHLGEISKATASFELYKSGNLTSTPDRVVSGIPVDASGNALTTVSLGVDNWTVKVNVDQGNGYWTASPIGMGTLTVALGSAEQRVTGGGWIPESAGKGRFGFTVNYQKSGSPKGNSVYLFHDGGYDYLVKSNSWQGGGLSFGKDPSRASFTGKAVVQKIDPATGEIVASYGNHTFTVDLIDGDRLTPKQVDGYAIAVLDASGGVWHRAGTSRSPAQLGGGNVSVHSK